MWKCKEEDTVAYCQRWRENRLRLVFSKLIEGYSVNSQPSKGRQAFFIFVFGSPGWVDGILANPRDSSDRTPSRNVSLDFLRIDTDQGYPAMRPGHVADLRRLRSQWIKEIPWFECHVIFIFLFFDEIYFDRDWLKL